jgi:hypothetical protein
MTTTRKFDAGRGARWLGLLGLVAFSLCAGACDRAHLTSYYGQSFNSWFAMQHVRSAPADSEATKRALGNLDAQEATTISKSYRHAFGSGQEGQGQGQMVMIGQAHGGNESYTPPPSVPNGQ